ncbi:MAG: hypothetical protein ACE5EM_13065 [Sphingomonadales bacterium]
MISVAVGLSIGFSGSYFGSQAVSHEVNQKLSTVMTARAQEIDEYFRSIREDLRIVANSPTTAQAIGEFDGAWKDLGGGQSSLLQALYISSNPHPLGEKDKRLRRR